MVKKIIYTGENPEYFSLIRWDIIEFIPQGQHKILEVGCGEGRTLIKLKELERAQEIYGLEINEKIFQNHKYELNNVFFGDVEQIEIPVPENFFDFIIFADVLEHLIDPEKILKKYSKLLKPHGKIIASIPNIKNFYILANLVFRDKFEYRDSGILDRTHLRFFTKKEINNMFTRSGLRVIKMKSKFVYPLNFIDKKIDPIFNMTSIPLSSFFANQYIVYAEKTDIE